MGQPLDWEKHKDEIIDLLMNHNKTLREVMEHMTATHDIRATERQYKYRIGRLKNVGGDEWAYIGEEFQRRTALGKQTVVYLDNRPLPQERVRRGIKRNGPGSASQVEKPVLNMTSKRKPPSAGRITFRTPSPAPHPARRGSLVAREQPQPDRSLAPTTSLSLGSPDADPSVHGTFAEPMYNASFDWLDDTGMFFGSPNAAPSVHGTLAGPMHNASFDRLDDAGMSFESGAWHETGVIDQPLLNAEESSFIPQHPSSPSHFTSTLASDSAAGAIITSYGCGFMRDLPFFQVLSTIEQFDIANLLVRPSSTRRLLGADYPQPGRPSPDQRTPSPTPSTFATLTVVRLLLSTCGSMLEPTSTALLAQVSNHLQLIIPQRYPGDLSLNLERMLNSSQPASTILPRLFAIAAFFASNNALETRQADAFLQWVVDQAHTKSLARFMEFQTPTVHAFAKVLFNSAIRIRNVQLLNTMLDRGLKPETGRAVYDIACIGDADLSRRALSSVDSRCFAGEVGGRLLQLFISDQQFDLARFLLDNGVSPDAGTDWATALYEAVDNANIAGIKFLLEAGADVNLSAGLFSRLEISTPLKLAVRMKNTEVVRLLLDNGATLPSPMEDQSTLDWARLHCKSVFDLLKQRVPSQATDFLLADAIDAATSGRHALEAYLSKRSQEVTTRQLEQTLKEAVRGSYIAAVVTLLLHGVNPDGPSLTTRPLVEVRGEANKRAVLVELLLCYGADVNKLKIRQIVSERGLLEAFLESMPDANRKLEALHIAIEHQDIAPVFILLRSGVDINRYESGLNALQKAAYYGHAEIILFLLGKGADINAPAHPDHGLTALQAALAGYGSLEVAETLLHHGADASAPPALSRGHTALEAFFFKWDTPEEDKGYPPKTLENQDEQRVCNKLLDAGATVNRPDGKPSSALHGIIEQGWHDILSRCLEPQHNTIINHMWCDEGFAAVGLKHWKPRTPVQLAASEGDLKIVRMLLDHGADINEAPGHKFGRTALQAAASLDPGPSKMELVHFLLDRGADIHTGPGPEGGVTALQAAAIAGDLLLADLLIARGANVNAWPSPIDGRTAIDGAAEHGRLDMVQLLLNAGAIGDVAGGTGFKRAIELAEENHRPVVAKLLRLHSLT